jgi:protein-S-isoprenylcysteine O-methyltransferase Ste14
MEPEIVDRKKVSLTLASRLLVGIPFIGAALFLPAGSFAYWNAWIFLGSILLLMVTAMVWLLARDPGMLAKRLQMKEKRATQKRFVLGSTILLVVAFLTPGLDFRFGWSHLPLWLVLTATALMVAGYVLFLLVIRFNRYASRVIEIQEGQKVIDSGPYRIVRHPMYASTVILYLAIPVVLGSWPALIVFVAFLCLLPIRILNEEKLLKADLPGYAEYMKKVRWRLIPFVW